MSFGIQSTRLLFLVIISVQFNRYYAIYPLKKNPVTIFSDDGYEQNNTALLILSAFDETQKSNDQQEQKSVIKIHHILNNS